MCKSNFQFLIFFMLVCNSLSAQYLVGFHSAWDDSVSEWELEIEIDSTTMIEGSLDMIWDTGGNNTEWNYRIGDIYGEIFQKFKGRDDQWEVRAGDEIIVIKQTFMNDPTEWKISSGDLSFTIHIYPHAAQVVQPREFFIDESFQLFQEVPGDVRDWIVDDYLPDEYSFNMRMAAAFITIYTSVYSIR